MTQDEIKGIEKLYKALDLLDEMDIKYPKKIENELNYIAWSVISDWYDSYEPHAYRRREDLFNAYKVIVTPTWFTVKFDSSFMEQWHHQQPEIIFHNAFELGYHGGSLGEGLNSSIPHWREPHPFFTNWGKSAISTFSPYEEIIKKMDEKIKEIDKEYDQDMKKVLRLVKAGAALL